MNDDDNMPDLDDAVVLGKSKGEFRTQKVVRIENDYYEVDENGGARGAWQDRPTKVRSIDRKEARRLLLEMGVDLSEVAQKTAEK